MSKKKAISKIGLKFTAVVVLSAIISLLLFGSFLINRYRLYHLFVDENKIQERTKEEIKNLQEVITEKHISKKNYKAIHNEMGKFRRLTMAIYDEREEIIKDSSLSKYESRAYVEAISFLLTLYEPKKEVFTLQFYDGSYTLIVYSYDGVAFMEIYLLVSAGTCIIFFVCTIMFYIHRKMRYIINIEEEMQLIESGDYNHMITYKGDDEITSLARQLNQMRNVLFDNKQKEEEARKANEELVTTMSHDLRTPLTSLLGYLDILSMHIYKNDEDLNMYLKKSKRKAEQIKDISDKLFNHFLVYSKDEKIELHSISSQTLEAFMKTQCDELIELHYNVHLHKCSRDYQIKGNEPMIHRILDNIFSNIKKYASKEMVVIRMMNEQGKLTLQCKNKVKKDISKEVSTRIGLLSIEKMMKAMHGNLSYQQDLDEFVVELVFPSREVSTRDET